MIERTGQPGFQTTLGEPRTAGVQLLSVEAAAKRLGLSRSSLYVLMDTGTLPYYKFPGIRSRRIDPADLQKLIESSRVERAEQLVTFRSLSQVNGK